MARVIPQEEFASASLHGVRVAILGYGNQGRAQALNLRDEGVDLVIGQRPGKSRDKATEDGMSVRDVSEASAAADVLMLTLPDETAGDIYKSEIAPAMAPGKTLLFTHGFNIHYGFIRPEAGVNVALVAPKGQARAVRNQYLAGKGVPGLVSVHQDADGNAWPVAFGYARAVGYTRSVLFETTCREETETDLFGEQAVLCGGMIELMRSAYQVLVDAGYSPEMAYFECVQETKLIIDLVAEKGFAEMRCGISDTAEWGGYMAGDRLVTNETRAEMRRILAEIQSGAFARGWVDEARQGKANLFGRRDDEAKNEIDRVGAALRSVINR